MGKWAQRRVYLLAFLGILILIGAAFLAPTLMGAEAESSARFSAADNLTT